MLIDLGGGIGSGGGGVGKLCAPVQALLSIFGHSIDWA